MNGSVFTHLLKISVCYSRCKERVGLLMYRLFSPSTQVSLNDLLKIHVLVMKKA